MKKTFLFIIIFLISTIGFSQLQFNEYLIDCVKPTASHQNNFVSYNVLPGDPLYGLQAGDIVVTTGFHSEDDGGGARYLIVDNSTGIIIPNHYYTLFTANASQNLFAVLIPNRDGSINLLQCGIGAPNSINGISIEHLNQIAFKEALDISKHIIIPEGVYEMNANINLLDGTKIEGVGEAIIKGVLALGDIENISISNITFDSHMINGGSYSRVILFNSQTNEAKNIRIENCNFKGNTFIETSNNNYNIVNLIISGCYFNSSLNSGSVPVIRLVTKNLIIENSTFNLTGANRAIQLLDGSEDITIKNNIFSGRPHIEMIHITNLQGNVYLHNNIFEIDRGRCFTSNNSLTSNLHITNNKVYSIGQTSNYSDILFVCNYDVSQPTFLNETVTFSNNIIQSNSLETTLLVSGKEKVIISNNIITGGNGINQPDIKCSDIKNLIISNNTLSRLSLHNEDNLSSPTITSQGTWQISNNTFTEAQGTNSLFQLGYSVNDIFDIHLMINSNIFNYNTTTTNSTLSPISLRGMINSAKIFDNLAIDYTNSNTISITNNLTSSTPPFIYQDYDNSWNPDENITPFRKGIGDPQNNNIEAYYIGEEYFNNDPNQTNQRWFKAVKVGIPNINSSNPSLIWIPI